MALRDELGPYFGEFGGRFVPESLVAALDELSAAYMTAKLDPTFQAELAELHRTYTGRPSIITEVPRFAEHAGGARIILKREDLQTPHPLLMAYLDGSETVYALGVEDLR